MTGRLHLFPFVVVGVAAALWGGMQAFGASLPDAGLPHDALAPAFAERAQRDTQITVWTRALAADTASAIALGQLAGLHLQRSREGGGWEDILAAEAFARRSLASRAARNGATAATLVSALVAQHRFAEAQVAAAALVEREPDVPPYRAMLAEVAMERGDYARAAVEFAAVRPSREHLSVAPRVARWHELRGEVAESRRLLERAVETALADPQRAVETKAWFTLRLAEFERRAERPNRAERSLRRGLALAPNDPRLLAAMTRLSASRGDEDGVLDWGERALAAELDPELILLVADAHAARGDEGQARRMRAAFSVAATARAGPFHRAWSLALLDRDTRVDEILERAEAELVERHDIYAYDLAAWANFKAGRVARARVLMAQALQLGTADPQLAAHQRAIASVAD